RRREEDEEKKRKEKEEEEEERKRRELEKQKREEEKLQLEKEITKIREEEKRRIQEEEATRRKEEEEKRKKREEEERKQQELEERRREEEHLLLEKEREFLKQQKELLELEWKKKQEWLKNEQIRIEQEKEEEAERKRIEEERREKERKDSEKTKNNVVDSVHINESPTLSIPSQPYKILSVDSMVSLASTHNDFSHKSEQELSQSSENLDLSPDSVVLPSPFPSLLAPSHEVKEHGESSASISGIHSSSTLNIHGTPNNDLGVSEDSLRTAISPTAVDKDNTQKKRKRKRKKKRKREEEEEEERDDDVLKEQGEEKDDVFPPQILFNPMISVPPPHLEIRFDHSSHQSTTIQEQPEIKEIDLSESLPLNLFLDEKNTSHQIKPKIPPPELTVNHSISLSSPLSNSTYSRSPSASRDDDSEHEPSLSKSFSTSMERERVPRDTAHFEEQPGSILATMVSTDFEQNLSMDQELKIPHSISIDEESEDVTDTLHGVNSDKIIVLLYTDESGIIYTLE
ncbi:hypothetical protein ADUPG1_010120, partial [Aduncisulcus paluster]